MANNPQFRIGIGSREICFVFSRISQTSSGHRPPLFTSKFVCFGLHSATSFRPDQLCHLANASVAYAYFVWVSTACVLANSILVGWFLIFHRPLLPHRYILIPNLISNADGNHGAFYSSLCFRKFAEFTVSPHTTPFFGGYKRFQFMSLSGSLRINRKFPTAQIVLMRRSISVSWFSLYHV